MFSRLKHSKAMVPASILVVVAALTSCAGAASNSPGSGGQTGFSSSTAAGEGDVCTPERAGGTLNTAIMFPFTSFDPIEVNGLGPAGASELAAVYDTLMQFDPRSGEIKPRMAQSLTANGDASVWTLSLRDNVAFAPGQPVTADAVKASIERHKNTKTALLWAQSQLIDTMTVVDARTLRFQLTQPWAEFPALLADKVGMITNPAVVNTTDHDKWAVAPPANIGAGAYSVSNYNPKVSVTLQAKSDYWGGAPCIKTIENKTIGTAQTAVDAFKTGEVSVVTIRDPQGLSELQKTGASIFNTLFGGGTTLSLNEKPGFPGADLRVRQAIAYGLDLDALNKRIFLGNGIPDNSLAPQGSILHQDGVTGVKYDLQKAKDLVSAAKADGWDGKIEYTAISGGQYQDMAIAVQAQLAQIGIDVSLKFIQLQDYFPVHLRADYQIEAWGVNVEDATPWVSLNKNVATNGGSNTNGYSNPAMDAALDQLRAATTLDDRKAAMATIQKVWNETIPHVVLQAAMQSAAWNDKVHGLGFSLGTIVFYDKAYVTTK